MIFRLATMLWECFFREKSSRPFIPALILLTSLMAVAPAVRGQSTEVTRQQSVATAPPRLLLNKSAKIVQYQLRRLGTDQLLLVERHADDIKYLPIHREILIRHGVPLRTREQALDAMQVLSHKSVPEILLQALPCVLPEDQETIDQLTRMLLTARQLSEFRDQLQRFTNHQNPAVRTASRTAQALLLGPEVVWRPLDQSGQADLLEGVRFLEARLRTPFLTLIATLLQQDHVAKDLQNAALHALVHIDESPTQRMQLALPRLVSSATRDAAIKLINSISPQSYSTTLASEALEKMFRVAEEVPRDRRGEDAFTALIECANNLIAVLPPEKNRQWRKKMASVSLRIVRIDTVFDQMRFDKPYFVVERSEEFQLVVRNQDMMPHNLVITVPGALQEIGIAASRLLPSSQTRIQYVPDSPKVLVATDMLPPQHEAKLMVIAPQAVGEYPYVCTFPNHWYRMYGVMLVVEDMTQWLQHPAAPADPLGRTRQFVKHWTIADLDELISTDAEPRESVIQQGAAIFHEAGCMKCHRVDCQGSTVGPALDGVLARHKGDRRQLMREIVDPSYAIGEEYANYTISLNNGGIVSGLIIRRTDEAVTVVSNPEDPQAVDVPRKDIEQISRLSVSLMPSGLMDQYTPAEIRSLLAFLVHPNLTADQ